MNRTTRFLPLAALCLSLTHAACKRTVPEEPAPPPAASAKTSAGATTCPTVPEWAASPETPENLLAEVVYIPETKDVERKGTGMRVYQTGLVVVWDELDVKMVDGEMKTARKPGAWIAEPVRATPELVKKLTDLVEGLPDAEIEGAQGKERTSQKKPNFVHARTKSGWKKGCYKGMTGNDAQSKVEAGIREIVGAVKEAAKKAAPAASAKSSK